MKTSPSIDAFPITSSSERLQWYDLVNMTRPGVVLLVVVTALPSMIMATGQLPNPVLVFFSLIGTAFVGASASVFNQIIDFEIDQKMARTSKRPIVSAKLSFPMAVVYACFLLGSGMLMLGFFANWTAAFVAFASLIFYIFVYSIILKKRTTQNIVIGGASGAVGPLIGWAAVSGRLDLGAWILFSVIFLWTPPHFWALALKYKDDYSRAKIPMLPVVYGEEKTRVQIFLYSLTLFLPIVGLFLLTSLHVVTLGCLVVLTFIFSWKAWKLYRSHSSNNCMDVFHYSCLYLFAYFGLLGIDQFAQALIS